MHAIHSIHQSYTSFHPLTLNVLFNNSQYTRIAPHCPAVQTERATNAAIHSARVRRYLSDSIYLWPCGEKSESDDEELTVSDGLIGWLTLLVSIGPVLR